jgi:LysM repeat protein
MSRLLRLALPTACLVAQIAALPVAAASPAAEGIIHTVQPGENLFRIGLQYGVSWAAIMQANGLSSTYIYTGQQLIIPTDAPGGPAPSVSYETPATYTVAWGDTLADIARRYGLTTAALAQANGLTPQSWVYTGQTLTLPGGAAAALPEDAPPAPEPSGPPQAAAPGPYIVQRGDSLWSIARAHGVTPQALAAANNLTAASWVYAGQALTIPSGGLPAQAPALAPAPVAAGAAKQILVDISEQRLYAYQAGALLYNFVASTGSPGRDTAPGTYSVLNKIPNAYGATWNIWMPNWLGIYWAGSLQNGIHALPILPGGGRLWDGWLGTPVSYGCVILGVWEAQTLYDWAEVGAPVVIQW